MQITLKKSNGIGFDGYSRHFHSNIDIQDWKRCPKTDSTQKIALRLVDTYLRAAEKGVAPERRVYIQNTALSMEVILDKKTKKPIDTLYEYDRRTVQKALTYLTDMGIIKYMLYEDLDGNTYKWEGGTVEDWQKENAGLTKRYIVLDINKAKELFAITHNHRVYKEADKRSRLRRFVMRRPFSLKKLGLEIDAAQRKDRADKVKTIREQRSTGYDAYLKIQMKRFGRFTDTDLINRSDIMNGTSDVEVDTSTLALINNFIRKNRLSTSKSS